MSSISRAIQLAGGPATVAGALGVSTQAVCFWRDSRRQFPVEHCARIEEMSGRQVRRWDLRPDDWHRIWPELIGAEGAPPIAETAKAA